jgi:hypothetical protein
MLSKYHVTFFEDLGVNGRMMLKLIAKEYFESVELWGIC